MIAAGARWRRWELPNEIEQVEAFTAEVVGWLDLPHASARFDVAQGVSEALSNAIIHGNLEVSSELRDISAGHFLDAARSRRKMRPSASRHVRVEAWRTDASD